MELNIQTAELALREAAESNPGAWAEHSRYVAEACKNIASHCKDLSSEQAYIFGLLHDIGRYAGVSSERHLIDGYRYCMERGWGKAARRMPEQFLFTKEKGSLFNVKAWMKLLVKKSTLCYGNENRNRNLSENEE